MIDAEKTIVVTGIGVVSPYGIGWAALRDGMLAGKSCLLPTTDLYPGFRGTLAQVGELPELAESHHFSRSDKLAVVAGVTVSLLSVVGLLGTTYRDREHYDSGYKLLIKNILVAGVVGLLGYSAAVHKDC